MTKSIFSEIFKLMDEYSVSIEIQKEENIPSYIITVRKDQYVLTRRTGNVNYLGVDVDDWRKHYEPSSNNSSGTGV